MIELPRISWYFASATALAKRASFWSLIASLPAKLDLPMRTSPYFARASSSVRPHCDFWVCVYSSWCVRWSYSVTMHSISAALHPLTVTAWQHHSSVYITRCIDTRLMFLDKHSLMRPRSISRLRFLSHPTEATTDWRSVSCLFTIIGLRSGSCWLQQFQHQQKCWSSYPSCKDFLKFSDTSLSIAGIMRSAISATLLLHRVNINKTVRYQRHHHP